MYKPSKSNTRLAVLSRVPATADLQQLMQLAQSYPGEIAEVSWNVEGSSYTLAVRLPAVNPKHITRKTISSSDTEWTLLTRKTLTALQEQAWTHTCADLEFISNLLAVLPCPASAPTDLSATQSTQSTATASKQFEQQPSQAPGPAASTPSSKADNTGGMVLSGDMSELELKGVLQSIALLKMSGCLEVHAGMDEVFLFFEEGILVHGLYESTLAVAEMPNLTGEQVLMELLLWDKGKFNFRPGKKSPEKSVNRRLEGLLTEAARLQDYWKYLLEHGVELESTVSRSRPDLSREEFDRIVGQGVPLNLGLQQKVYLEINGKKTLYEIVSKFRLPRLAWIPVIFNLHNTSLIAFTKAQQEKNGNRIATPQVPDDLTLNKAKSNLSRIESGMMSYDLVYHFLKLEFARARKQSSHCFSVLVFSIYNVRTSEPLSVLSVSKLTEFIEKVKEELDLLAHYREHDYIMLCPYRDVQQTASLAEQVANSLKQCQIDGLTFQELKLGFGIASVPQNSSELIELLSLAETAKNAALSEGRLLVISADKTG